MKGFVFLFRRAVAAWRRVGEEVEYLFHEVIAVPGTLDSLEGETYYDGAVFAAVECRSGHKVVLFVSHESAASFGIGGIK